MKIRILLADDFPAFRELVEGLLEPEFDVIGKVVNGEALIAAALDLDPEVVITDISMPVLSGIDAVRNILQLGSRAKVLFLTVHSGADFVRLCFDVGARAYVLKSQVETDLFPGIREVLADRTFISSVDETAD
jgi:DNA-binding NarL/FixJ family response regulator